MNKTPIFIVLAMTFGFLMGCATTEVNKLQTKKDWSIFSGEEVTDIGQVYPDGDAPKDLIKTKKGTSFIF